MKTKSLQLSDLRHIKTIDDLVRAVNDNFEAIKLLMDGLTGERLESWTPVARDGSITMTGDLTLVGGSLKVQNSAGTSETSIRLGGDGTLEHRDNVNADYTSVYDPEYKDVTSDRALDTVYKNKNKHRLCQITLKMETT